MIDNERKLLYLIIAIAVLVACITMVVGVVFASAATGSTTITMAIAALADMPLIVRPMGLTVSIS